MARRPGPERERKGCSSVAGNAGRRWMRRTELAVPCESIIVARAGLTGSVMIVCLRSRPMRWCWWSVIVTFGTMFLIDLTPGATARRHRRRGGHAGALNVVRERYGLNEPVFE